MSEYFTAALWFAIVTGVSCVVATTIHALVLKFNRWVARPTIPRTKARKARHSG